MARDVAYANPGVGYPRYFVHGPIEVVRGRFQTKVMGTGKFLERHRCVMKTSALKNRIESPLQTPTDLTAAARRMVTAALNEVLEDTF
jgi:hypothetical protein